MLSNKKIKVAILLIVGMLCLSSCLCRGGAESYEIAPGVIARVQWGPVSTHLTITNMTSKPIEMSPPSEYHNFRMFLDIDTFTVIDGIDFTGSKVQLPAHGERT